MSLIEAPCTNPECERVTLVKWYPDTRYEPGYPETDTCDSCGEWLDFEESDRLSDADIEEMRYENHPDAR